MSYKVTFENNIPNEAKEDSPGVILKKYSIENDLKIFDWIFVDARSEEEALEKAKKYVQDENAEA